MAEVGVTLISLLGITKPGSIEWRDLKVSPMPLLDDIRGYNRSNSMTPDRNKLQKYFADLSRVCEVEDFVEEWFDKQCYESVSQDSLKQHVRRQIDGFLE
jgi:hypothetical protein